MQFIKQYKGNSTTSLVSVDQIRLYTIISKSKSNAPNVSAVTDASFDNDRFVIVRTPRQLGYQHRVITYAGSYRVVDDVARNIDLGTFVNFLTGIFTNRLICKQTYVAEPS